MADPAVRIGISSVGRETWRRSRPSAGLDFRPAVRPAHLSPPHNPGGRRADTFVQVTLAAESRRSRRRLVSRRHHPTGGGGRSRRTARRAPTRCSVPAGRPETAESANGYDPRISRRAAISAPSPRTAPATDRACAATVGRRVSSSASVSDCTLGVLGACAVPMPSCWTRWAK